MTRVEVDTFPNPVVLSRSRETEMATKAILLECAGAFSPRVEERSQDTAFLCGIDISGSQSLFGPPEMLARSLVQRVRAIGIMARVTVSSNFQAAVCLAKGLSPSAAVRVVPPGEEAMARYPQFFSRIGFVHEFRPLSDSDIQLLLEQRWAPVGLRLPASSPAPEVVAAVIRLTRGNFRLLVRLLTQMERVLAINDLDTLSVDVVETARENLVIGQA